MKKKNHFFISEQTGKLLKMKPVIIFINARTKSEENDVFFQISI